MRPILFDIEADGLLDTMTKVHCLVAKDLSTGEVTKFYDRQAGIVKQPRDYSLRWVAEYFSYADILIGHNIIGYDNDILEDYLGVDCVYTGKDCKKGKRTIDTLVWSQTLNPDRKLPKGCPTSIYNPVTGKNDKVGPHSVHAWGYRVSRAKPSIFDWTKFTPDMLHRCEEDVGIEELILDTLIKEAGTTREEMFSD